MDRALIHRTLEPILTRAATEFPAVVLTGPRQSGKTTILRHLFGGRYGFVSLEAPDVSAAALADPRGFLAAWPPPVILDEIQRAPGLLPYIQERIDSRRSLKGQYLLSGSQNLFLMQEVTESLAGRTAVLRLLPLSRREIVGTPFAPLPWETGALLGAEKDLAPGAFWPFALRGGYPELAAEPGRDAALWFSSYLQTYLERDVRSLRQVGDLTQFQGFLQTLATRSAQLVNFSDMGRDLGLSSNTVRAWVSVLEASHQILILRPYFANVGKRLVKTPKVYWTDTGLLCHLMGLKDPAHAAAGPMGGAIAETAAVLEVYKTLCHRGEEPRLFFWRTATGEEVDLILIRGDCIIPVEVKATATPLPALARGIHRFRQAVQQAGEGGYVVHLGNGTLPLGQGVTALPFSSL